MKKSSKRSDGRKRDSAATRAKKANVARGHRGVDAFTSNPRAERILAEKARIDAVVAAAQAKDAEAEAGAGVDVIRDHPRMRTLKACRVG